jgi:hypothetical protein
MFRGTPKIIHIANFEKCDHVAGTVAVPAGFLTSISSQGRDINVY